MTAFPLPLAKASALGLDDRALDRLQQLITRHIADGRYPGAQVAMARRGQLALSASFGDARTEPKRTPATDDTLWLLYSNTKVVTACAVWLLVEQGALSFGDTVASHLPGFDANGKGDITIFQVLTHQGGFPGAQIPETAWADHDVLRNAVCGITLEWTPGSKVQYHPAAAHWVIAAMIDAVTKSDYRDFIRQRITEPLGLAHELFVGLPDAMHARAAVLFSARCV